jgi:argininosuccinate lyase
MSRCIAKSMNLEKSKRLIIWDGGSISMLILVHILKLFSFEQEDKEPLFDSVKAILGMLEVCTEFAQNISFNSKRIQRSLPAGYLDATTLADYLVKKVNSCCPRL